MKASPKRILITGGAGFIGSHLCKYLLNQGKQVICLDNFFTSSKENIEHLLNNKDFVLIERDINESLSKLDNLDRIYNLASPASPVHYQSSPIETIKTNTLGVFNVLELAKKKQVRILQASTSEVYGDPQEHPQKESYWGNANCVGVRACYDEGKRCAETLFMDYHRQYGLEIKIARIFNTYGPNMVLNDGRVVSNFIIQALKGEDLTIYGDGSQTRSFQYVDDLIEAMTKFMDTPRKITGPLNMGNPQEISIKDLAEKIISLTKSKSRISYKPLPEDDPVRRCPDISLARKVLNWEPKVSLEEGLKKTINYFKTKI